MNILEALRDYCNKQDSCCTCDFSESQDIGCPFARMPKFWSRKAVEDLEFIVVDNVEVRNDMCAAKRPVNYGSDFARSVKPQLLKIQNEMQAQAFSDAMEELDFSYLDLPIAKSEGEYVANKLTTFPFHLIIVKKFYVSMWRPNTWKFKWTAAYTDNENITIYINASVPKSNYLFKLAHEVCHLAGFGHGRNYMAGNRGKQYKGSVPVKVEEYFRDRVMERNI